MHDLGISLGRLLHAGDVVVLTGPLGAGKTTLTKGIGEGLNVISEVTSPTFVFSEFIGVDANYLSMLMPIDSPQSTILMPLI